MVVQSLSTIHRYFMENVIVQYGKCKLADAKYGGLSAKCRFLLTSKWKFYAESYRQ